MRDAGIRRQLHTLGVNHDHTHLIGSGAHDHGSEHGVDETRLSGACGTGYQQVRHLGQIGRHEVAFHILADTGQHRVRIVHGLVGAQHVAKHHGFAVGVRNFDADGRLAFDHGQDAHIGAGHRIGDVLLQVGDLLDFDARPELHLVHGHGRTSQEADDLGIHAELLEGAGQGANHTVILRRVHGMRHAFLEHAEVGKMIRGVRNVRLRPIVAMRAIHVVHDLAGRGVDHHGIAIGCPVFVDGGPRIVGNGTDLLDLARWSGGGRHGAACRADGFG